MHPVVANGRKLDASILTLFWVTAVTVAWPDQPLSGNFLHSTLCLRISLHARFTHVLQQQFFEKVFLQNVPRTGPSDRGIYLTSHFLFLVCPEGPVRGPFRLPRGPSSWSVYVC